MSSVKAVTCGLVFAIATAVVVASDRWETTFQNITDDSANTLNVLRHGLPQFGHDLEGTSVTPDQDWWRVRVTQGHSYEARVSSSGVHWNPGCGAPPCPRFDRVDAAGAILSFGVVSSDETDLTPLQPGLVSTGMNVRWTASATATEFLRTVGDQFIDLPANLGYDVDFHDTTYFLPRWNNSATQVTVLMVQNTASYAVTGAITFYNAAGGEVRTVGLTLPARGLQVTNTASFVELAGLGGSAMISHSGTYGTLAGKAVALEPATGFTFDTPITPVPR